MKRFVLSPEAWQADVMRVEKPPPPITTGRPFWRFKKPKLREGKIVKGGMWAKQRQWWELQTFIKGLIGGYGCISGDTRILNPLLGEEVAVEVLYQENKTSHVLALLPDGSQTIAEASVPFVKGIDDLYRVTLADGRKITVTKEHRFFTRIGWRKLSEVCVGDDLGCAASHLESILADARSAHAAGERRCFEIGGDYRDGYSVGCHPDDEPLREVEESALVSLPLLTDALAHNPRSLHKDGQGSEVEHSHVDQYLRLRSSNGFSPLTEPLCGDEGFLASPSGGELPPHYNLFPGQSHGWSSSYLHIAGENQGQWKYLEDQEWPSLHEFGFLRRAREEHGEPDQCLCETLQPVSSESSLPDITDTSFLSALDSFQDHNAWVHIVNVEWVGREKFYDLTVPGPANYLAQGIWNHNSGKTFIGGKRVISSALHNSGCMIAAVSPTFPQAKKTIIPTIKALLAGKQTLDNTLWWKYNKNEHEFRIRHKGRDGLIQVMSAEDPDSLRGPNIAAAWLDEPFIMDQAVLEQMVARIRHPDSKLRELLLTGTPEQLNWGFSLFMGELKGTYEGAGTTIGMVQVSSRENLATGQDYIKRLEGAFTDKAAEAYIDGGFVNLSKGQVYYAFKSMGENSNVQSYPIPDGAQLGCGMDFNVNPMSAAVFWVYGNHMHFFDEFELPNADTELLCSDLYEKYVNPQTRVTPHHILEYIYPDAAGVQRHTNAPAGKTDFHFIREAGFQVMAHSKQPRVKDRYNAVNGKFQNSMGKVTLTISPKCKKLTQYLLTYTHELKNKQKHMSHLLDAFSYPVEYLFPIVHTLPKVVGITGH